MVLVAIVPTRADAWAVGFILGETKEQLKLQYDVSVYDHNTGRVTVTITIADDGRLRPLDSVDLHFPSTEKHADGIGTKSDLSLSLAMRHDGKKRVATVHLRNDWAERAEFWLTTSTLDGKRDPTSRQHHVIQVAKYKKNVSAAAAKPAAASTAESALAAPPATE